MVNLRYSHISEIKYECRKIASYGMNETERGVNNFLNNLNHGCYHNFYMY